MGFYQQIQQNYGLQAFRILKQWATLNTKLASLTNRRIFLLQCRKQQVFPKHIIQGLKNINTLLIHHEGPLGNTIASFETRVRRKILNLEISITISSLNRIQKDLNNTITKASSLLPAQICKDYQNSLNSRYNKLFKNIKSRNMNKIRLLRDERFATIKTNNKWFKNISDTHIPPDVTKVLALGPKFSVSPNSSQFKIPSLLADLETIIAQFDEQQKNIYRGQFTNIITNFLHKSQETKDVLSNTINNTKKFLKEHPEIITTLSDKGNVTVVMNKIEYMTLSHRLLSDTDYYIPLPRDPTLTLERKANALVKSLNRKQKLDDTLAKNLMSYSTVAPRFYALPKIHKPQLALRPIISSINAPSGKLSKFLTVILTNAYNTDNEFYISDSFNFSTFINDFQLPSDHILISLDVVSLFTNLPLNLAILSIKEKWTDISQHTSLDLDSFLELVNFVFDSTFFIFDNQFYKQVQGLPMGASISPIISNYVLVTLVHQSVSKLSFNVPFLKRYVDDLILAVPSGAVDEVLLVFNQTNPKLQFTLEREINNMIPFLDMMLLRTPENKIITKWYTKGISSGRYLNFHSNHPTKMKLGLVTTLTKRVTRLTHHSLLQESITKLKSLLTENSYPTKIINRLCNNIPQQPVLLDNDFNPQTTTNNTNKSYGVLPYITDLTPRLINIFKDCGVRFAMRCDNNLQSLYTPLKSPLNIQHKYNIVYNLPCKDCNLNYVGQTTRLLKNRITSHKSDIRLQKNSCALAQHVIDHNHNIDYNNVTVIYREPNYYKRKFLEMVAINDNPLTMNKRSDTEDLSSVYLYILQLNKGLTQRNQHTTQD